MKSTLMERVQFLTQALSQAHNNYFAVAGQLEEAKFLLKEIELKEKEEPMIDSDIAL